MSHLFQQFLSLTVGVALFSAGARLQTGACLLENDSCAYAGNKRLVNIGLSACVTLNCGESLELFLRPVLWKQIENNCLFLFLRQANIAPSKICGNFMCWTGPFVID